MIVISSLERCKQNLYYHAAENGYLSILRWLHVDQRIPLPLCRAEKSIRDICLIAARNGHQNVLEWIISITSLRLIDIFHQRPESGASLCSEAAHGGHLSLLKWLHNAQNFPLDTITFAEACRGGHLEVVRWLVEENKCAAVDSTACAQAARGASLETLKYLRANRIADFDTRTIARAAGKQKKKKKTKEMNFPSFLLLRRRTSGSS